MIVVIDTNLFLSYLMQKHVDLKPILLDTDITIAYSEKSIEEFLRKIHDKKFRKYLKVDDALEFIKNFAKRGDLIQVNSNITVCRDAKDNFLLSLSKDSSADYLITGDEDLLTLGKFEKTIICTIRVFLDKYLIK